MPEVVVARRLKIFLEDDLDKLFPRDRWVRAVAHPTRLPAQVAPVAPCDGDGEAKAAAAGVEARVGEGADNQGANREMGSDGAEPILVPGLRFSQVEPPKGDACLSPFAGVISLYKYVDLFCRAKAGLNARIPRALGSRDEKPTLSTLFLSRAIPDANDSTRCCDPLFDLTRL